MNKAVAINGSPRGDKGYTDTILQSFLEGMRDGGVDVATYYVNRLQIKSCTGEMHCWYKKPGECHIKDDMQRIYPEIRAAETLILATPVYIPLPAEMQKVLNRLCPLGEPFLEFREGRTRGRIRKGVLMRKIVLVSTGGWWEKENMDTVVRIATELAADFGIEFEGALLRPHAFLMKSKGILTKEGEEILDAARKAGSELARDGVMSEKTLERVSRPLISEEELRRKYNEWVS